MRSINLNGLARQFGAFLLSALIVFAVGCREPNPVYEAEIRRTVGGIPHIKAEDFGSLGFGTGYAAAEDNICLLAENVLRLRGQLSRYFGPGENDENLKSDFFYQLMIDRGMGNRETPVEFETLFLGYAAGYNRYLRDTGADNITDPSCQGAGWLGEITIADVKRINTMPFWLPNFQSLIIAAEPPAVTAAAPSDETVLAHAAQTVRDLQTQIAALVNPEDKGSNGIALGREATANGTGMLLANPHMSWEGMGRFYPFHQTIPGVLDMLGATVLDRANVGFGMTEHVAWTNTVSPGLRYSFYSLELDPTDPTVYMFDGEPRDMITEEVAVTVLNPDGSIEERTHTFYSTHFGFVVGGRFPWLPSMAFAFRLADEGDRNFDGAIACYKAESVRDIKAANDTYQHTTTYTIAADSSGEVLFGDLGPLAYLTDDQVANCLLYDGPVLDGASSDCQWCDDPDAAVPGILPPDELPFLFRDDYVTNSNDTYWLTNSNEPLTGYNSSLRGLEEDEATERTLRTRSGLRMVQQRLDGSDGLEGTKFTLDQLIDRALSNQNYSAQLLRDDLVTLCNNNPIVDILDDDGNVVSTVDISEAGSVLAAWDLHANLESEGEHLFREFMREANEAGGGGYNRWLPSALNSAVPFDPEDPLETPRGLDTEDNPVALQSLAKAVQTLRDAGIALDTPLGDLQGVVRNGEFIPIHGGSETEGVFNKVEADLDPESNRYIVDESSSHSSWIWATEFTEDGPEFRGILTYSISANPNSPHYADLTKMYSQKEWLDIPFRDEDVAAAALETTVVSEGASDCFNDGWKEFGHPEFDSCIECLAHFQILQFLRVTEFSSGQED